MTTINKKGFTLIELLIVIAIIGILSGFLLTNFAGARQRARDGVRKSDLRQIQSALEFYRSDKGVYPTAPLSSCGSSLRDNAVPPVIYMSKIPCDPLDGSNYTYVDSGGTRYTLTACIENTNDSQKDSSVVAACASPKTGASYTLVNP